MFLLARNLILVVIRTEFGNLPGFQCNTEDVKKKESRLHKFATRQALRNTGPPSLPDNEYLAKHGYLNMAELLVDRPHHKNYGWTDDAIACVEEFKIEDFEHNHQKASDYQYTLYVPDYGICICYSSRCRKPPSKEFFFFLSAR